MMKTPIHIPVSEPDLSGNEKKYVDECISSTWISSKGKFINEFEESFAQFLGVKYAVAAANGTVALHLTLVSLGIGKGNEVLVPDLTFVASANAVSYTGAKPVFVDVERNTWNIDPGKIEEKITKRTKAIIVVHLYGYPADMNRIMTTAKKYNLLVIEDAAEAHGAEVKMKSDGWKKAGGIGIAGCFSFYGNKIITTGEGGMIVTNEKNLMEKMRILRDHGQDPKKRYYHRVMGFNYRLTNLQAAVGLAQLERINEFISKKREIAKLYTAFSRTISGIHTQQGQEWARSVFWMYSLLIEKDFGKTRDQVMRLLEMEGIETRPFFIPLHRLPFYRTKEHFPNAAYLSHSGLNLPSSVTLKEEQIRSIVSCIKKFA